MWDATKRFKTSNNPFCRWFRHIRQLADGIPGVIRAQMGVAARNRLAVVAN